MRSKKAAREAAAQQRGNALKSLEQSLRVNVRFNEGIWTKGLSSVEESA